MKFLNEKQPDGCFSFFYVNLLQIIIFNMHLARHFLIFLLVSVAGVARSQSDTLRFTLSDASTRLGYTHISVIDPYLSPMKYSGGGICVSNESRKLFSPDNTVWSMQSMVNASAGTLYNQEGTAGMIYAGGNFGWGTFAQLVKTNNFRLHAGGQVDAIFAVKYLSRNVNNPVNFDMALNLNLALNAGYQFTLFRVPFSCQLDMASPVLGYMFVPLQGASYYEMFDVGKPDDAYHFSFIHNKQGLKTSFMLSIPFRNFTINAGVTDNSLKYKANGMVFTFNELSLQAGLRYQFKYFGGTRKKAPASFVSPGF